jgi:hypothetical protein
MSAGFMGRPEKATKVDPRDPRKLEKSPVGQRRVKDSSVRMPVRWPW